MGGVQEEDSGELAGEIEDDFEEIEEIIEREEYDVLE